MFSQVSIDCVSRSNKAEVETVVADILKQKKPYSAVTVAIESLTSERYEEDDFSGIPDLVEAIKLQSTGPTEAARAIRKKLKYGNVHRQLRALVILDGLIQNAGSRFQRTFADEMLLERLRVCGTSDLSDPIIRKKCEHLFRSWAREYKGKPGLEAIAGLYKQMPRRKQAVTQDKSKVIRETENPFEAEDDPEDPEPSARMPQVETAAPTLPKPTKETKKEKVKADKKGGKWRAFNLEAEKEKIQSVIADSSIASTNLLNTLRLINREQVQISENKSARKQFDECKLLRRKVLRYLVDSEKFLGALLDSNDKLVNVLMTFEQLDRSIDADSDSDDEVAQQAHLFRTSAGKAKEADTLHQLSGLSIASPPAQPPRQPPRPVAAPVDNANEEEDEDDPFADRNEVETPGVEKAEPRWTKIV